MLTKSEPNPERVFVGLGSNLGDREKHLSEAINWLRYHPNIELLAHTGSIETEPWGPVEQPTYLNSVVLLRTALQPGELLETLKKAEGDLGRVPRSPKWGPREIDLDIILFGNRIINTDDLVVPHPRMTERTFVLRQLLELDSTLKHPISNRALSSY